MFARDHVLKVKKLITGAQESQRCSIRQQRLDRNTLQLKGFTNSSFAKNLDLKSQLGYVILLTDASGKANILHFASYNSQRIVRSVLGGETYGFADSFDYGYLLCYDLEDISGQPIPSLFSWTWRAFLRI